MKAAQAEARRVAATQRDTIAALAIAMPPALAARFDSLARCMEASVVGARILRDATRFPPGTKAVLGAAKAGRLIEQINTLERVGECADVGAAVHG